MLAVIIKSIHAQILRCITDKVSIVYGTYQDNDTLKTDKVVYISFSGITDQVNPVMNISAPLVVIPEIEYSIEYLIKDPSSNMIHLDAVYNLYYALVGFHPCCDTVKRFRVSSVQNLGRQENGYYLYTLSLSIEHPISKSALEMGQFDLYEIPEN